jgi:2-polyprenyl-3-methyl-5-hydroxy-6-metoxy-1,4-benzoquinol methylase
LERNFFEWTKELYELEKVLQTPIQDSMHWTRRFEYPWILTELNHDNLLSLARRDILDAGAGATALQFLLARHGNRMTAIDPDQAAIDWINNRRASWGMPQSARLGGFPSLPFKDSEFEAGICISVLEHLPKDQVLPSIRELLRVSRKEVLITMDVVLGNKHSAQVDQSDFNQHMQTLKIAVPEPDNRITFQMNGYMFGVACIHITKD